MSAPVRPRGPGSGRLLIAVSVIAGGIVIAAVAGAVAAGQHSVTARELARRDYIIQRAAGQLQESFTASQLAISNYALSGRPAFLRPVSARRAAFTREAAALRAIAPPSVRAYVTAEARAGAQLFATLSRITQLPAGSPAARPLANDTVATARTFSAASASLQATMTAEVRQLASGSWGTLSAVLLWCAVAAAAAALLVLTGAIGTLRTVTRPLHGLADTVRRLTAGDDTARADVRGSAEVRAVAEAINAQAEEAGRLRAREAESSRLRAMAREAGLRIREHLVPLDVLNEAWQALEQNLSADVVYLRVLQEDKVGAPIGRRPSWLRPADVIGASLTPEQVGVMERLLRAQSSMVVQDVQGGDPGPTPPQILAMLRREGVASQVLTPFGADSTLLGVIVLQRMKGGSAWSRAEVDAVESIAADLGRGLSHARMYEAENRLVAELQALDRAKSDFFATVSHELRAPLTSIEGYVEMLREGEAGPVTGEQLAMLNSVDRSAARLRDLIEDVFTLSRLESGAEQLSAGRVDLAEVISGAVDAIRPAATTGELTLAVPATAGPVVEGDAGQLDRLFINLLSNAVKFTPPGGRIEVSTAVEQAAAVVRVADTGIGIPADDQQELFTRFFRAANARERAIPGTGLGLAIVRTIVRMHHGDVRLDSREGRGTTVTVRLPLPGEAGGAGGSGGAGGAGGAAGGQGGPGGAPLASRRR